MLEKIKKLLALSCSSNEHEAAAALTLAHKLMAEHRITMAQVDVAEVEPLVEETFYQGFRTATWRKNLIVVLARENHCVCTRHSRLHSLSVAGQVSDVEVAKYLYAYVARQIDALAGRHRGAGAAWLAAYRFGCVQAIEARLRAMQQQVQEAAVPEHAEKAIVKADSLAERIREEFKFAPSATPRPVRLNRDARTQGQTDGAAIRLNRGHGLDAPSNQLPGK